MNINVLLNSRKFKNYNQFKKRSIVRDFILKEENLKIGLDVICYDLETHVNEKDRYFYDSRTINRTRNLTIGKKYKIINIKGNQIKVENDKGYKIWYTRKRFLYLLKLERYSKLEEIEKNNKV
jgi:hypothetical protein